MPLPPLRVGLVAVLVSVVGASTGCADQSTRDLAPATESSVAPACAPHIDNPTDPAIGTRRAQLVPDGAKTATLCEYDVPRGANRPEWPLSSNRSLARPVPELVDYLNDRPLDTKTDRVCPLGNPSGFRIVLGYPDGGSATVVVDMACGTLERDGVVRDIGGAKEFMGYWTR